MPIPLALAAVPGVKSIFSGGLGGVGTGILNAAGFGGQRGRTPAQNRRMRQNQVKDAEAMARAGDQFGVDLLRAWTGDLPSLSVSRPDYRSGVGQGRMPADGVALAREALARLQADGIITAAGRLRAGGKSASSSGKSKAASQEQTKGTTARSTRTRGGPRERTYVRYDPDTGERVLVPRDDPRYVEWSNRKPSSRSSARSRSASRSATSSARSRRKTKAQRETDAAIRRITTEATRAGIKLTTSAARWFASAAAAAGMSTAAAAALVVGTGLAAYAATRWLVNKIEDVTDPAYKREQVALAYRRARLDWERQEGRKLNKTEHDFLARNFKDALKALDAGVTYNP